MFIYDKAFTDPEYSQFNPERYKVVRDWVQENDFDSVLDVGCGRGYYLSRLQDLRKHVIGLEPSTYLIENDLLGLPVIHADMLSTTGEWEALYCMDVLEHISPHELNKTLEKLASFAQTGLLGIANHSDPWEGMELHLIRENAAWWRKKLLEYYSTVKLMQDLKRYFIFEVER